LVLLCVGCRPKLALEVMVSEVIGTVITVQWTTPEDTLSHLEFGRLGSLNRRTATSTGTTHEAVLIGLLPEEIYQLQAVVGDDRGEIVEVTSGSLPSDLPELILTGDPDALPGHLVVPILGTAGMTVIISPGGEILWHHPLNERDTSYRAWLDRGAATMTFNNFSMDNSSRIERLSLDGLEHEILDYNDHNHDFLPLPGGGLAAIATIQQEVDGEAVSGDGIFRIDMEGQSEPVWSAWDHFEYVDQGSQSQAMGGWSHANALDYDAEEDAFYLSLRSFDAITKIQGQTGALEWILSGDPALSDFAFVDGSTPTSHQHQFELLDGDRLLSFDNRYDLQEPARVVEFALDFETMTAEEVWSYQHDPELSVYALGDVDRQDDGSTLIVWSTSGVIQYLSPEGEELWRLNTGLGYAFGYASLIHNIDQ
jgi:hypothetical protein